MTTIIVPSRSAGGDLTGVLPNALLAHYRTILRSASRAQASVVTGSGTYLPGANGSLTTNNTNASYLPFYLDPAAWSASGFSTKLRLIVGCLVTDTQPTQTFTWGLYPVSAWAGTTTATNMTLGSVTSGSTVPFASPAANSMTAETSSGDFAFPSAGWFVVAVAISAAMTANSNPTFSFALQVRNV